VRITDILVSSHVVELTRPYEIAFTTFNEVEMISVQLHTSDDIVGYGTGTPAPYVTGENLKMALGSLNDNTIQSISNKDFSTPQEGLSLVEHLFTKTPAALAALDIALFDAFSKQEKKPLVDYLGRYHKALPTSITIGIKDSVDLMLEEAREYIERGFRVIKLKLGKNLEYDIEYTRALRSAIPKNVQVYVDPNQGYSIADYRSFLKATADANIAFVEQPVSTEATDTLFTLSEQEKQFVCIDESLRTIADLRKWESKGTFPAQLLNIKLMKCGGIAQATLISEIAEQYNLDLMLGCMDESCASIAAALHFAYSQKRTKYIDLDGSLDLARDIFCNGFDIIDGYMHINEGIGLGVKPLY